MSQKQIGHIGAMTVKIGGCVKWKILFCPTTLGFDPFAASTNARMAGIDPCIENGNLYTFVIQLVQVADELVLDILQLLPPFLVSILIT